MSNSILLGYWFGEDWERTFHMVHRHLTVVLIAAGVLLAI